MGKAPAAVRAGPRRGELEWDGADFAMLLEEARSFDRVGPAAVADPAGLIAEVVGGFFGASTDGAGGRSEVAPWVPEGWKSMALRRLRCHRTLVDVELRPRAEWCTVRLSVTFGPPIPLLVSLHNTPSVARVTVDEVALPAAQALFTLSSDHELMFFYGESS